MRNVHEEEALGKAYDARLMRRLMEYMRPYKWRVILALSLVAIVTPLELSPPIIFGWTIDHYFSPALKGSLPESAAWRGVIFVSIGYLLVLIFDFLAQYVQIRIMQRVGQQTMYDMRTGIFAHLQRLPMSYFDRNPVGRLVTRVTTDVDALNDLFAAGVVTMINDFFLLAVMAAVLFKIDWRLALDTLSVLPCILIVTYVFRHYVRDANRHIRTAIARINSFLQEYISGMSIVQIFNREVKARAEFAKRNKENMVAWRSAILSYALFYPAVEILSVAAIALIYWAGGNRVLAGTLSLGVLTMFTMFATRFFRPIQDLSEKFNILQSAMAASERIFKLLDEPATVCSPTDAIGLANPRGEIEFRNVWFSYRPIPNPGEDDWVLRDVSFRIEPGQTLAIVGHTGAGKTTLISLLLRFYDVQRGQILLDGIDIRKINLQDLRRLFGIVLQDPFLFTGTIESNVRLGTPRHRPFHRRAIHLRNRSRGFYRVPPRRRRRLHQRARLHALGRPAPAHQLRSRPRAQSALPYTRRSHLQRRYQDRAANSRRPRPSPQRPHRARHRPPPKHNSACRPHPRLPQRPPPRARRAPGAPRPARHLLPPLPAPIQRARAASPQRR